MRVDAFSKISQIYQSNTVKRTQRQSKASKTDKIEISNFGQSLAIAKQAVSDAPDIRADRVACLKEQISNGTYNVSDEEIADKIVGGFYL